MWTIEQLEEMRDESLADIVELFPDEAERLVKPRISVDHTSTSSIARYTSSNIKISAFLLSDDTTRIFLHTLIMKGLLKIQFQLYNGDPSLPIILTVFQKHFPEKYDFGDMKDYAKHNVTVPKKEGYKYAVRCPKCGEVFRFKRMCKTVRNPHEYVCGRCNVSLERM